MTRLDIGIGTSGFSYDGWKGVFYPEGLAAAKRLSFYASKLGAVEINNTFYRMPKQSVVETWAAQVPETFRFAIKASRRITHFKRLKDAAEETGYLLQVTGVLGSRLGALLFQLPPNLKCDRDRLCAFLETLPADAPAAFEFRHPSWLEEGARELVEERGMAWVAVHGPEDEPLHDRLPEELGETGLRYLRLRAESYDGEDLLALAQGLSAHPEARALVFFKHEDAGAGPALAARLQERVEAESGRRKPLRSTGPDRQKVRDSA